MTIMDCMRLVADATQVPLNDLTFVGSRRYGPEAPVRFVDDTYHVMGRDCDIDIVVPWDGSMDEMRERIRKARPEFEDHPNRQVMPYEGCLRGDLNLTGLIGQANINLMVKHSFDAAEWRAAADVLDRLSIIKPVPGSGAIFPHTRSGLWWEKRSRVAAFKAARGGYTLGWVAASALQREASFATMVEKQRVAAATLAKEEEVEARHHLDLTALQAKYDKLAWDSHVKELELLAQLRVRGVLMVAFLVAFGFLVWYIGQI